MPSWSLIVDPVVGILTIRSLQLHHDLRNGPKEFVHVVLLLATLEEVQQRLLSCPACAVALGPLPMLKLGLHSNWLLA